MSRTAKLIGPLVLWTLFVWASRIRNIWSDDDLSTGGQVLRTFFAIVFLTFAIVLARRLYVSRGGELSAGDRRVLALFIAWTVGFWLVRGIGIIVDDHAATFTIVHTTLMVISIGIALVASKMLSPRSISSSPVVAQ